jgi:hydroxyethylthiazole kinase-like uncharacterized protein yjeF
MIKVVTNQQMKQMDQYTINKIGIPGMVLMENAGYQSADIIDEFCSEHQINNIFIFAGKGNNGGDGFVIARHLVKRDFNVLILMTCDMEELSGDALTNADICQKSKIKVLKIKHISDLMDIKMDTLIVDALLGTGIKGAVTGIYKDIIDWINRQDAFVAAVDIPSGLNGNSAVIEGSAVEADFTITMALPKCAHLFYPARDCIGQLFIADIGMPKFIEDDPDVRLNLIDETDIVIPRPEAWQNKYSAGTVFMLAGSPGMTGAAVMAAQSASIAGSGLVSVGIPIELNDIFETKLTEELTTPLPCADNCVLSAEALPQIYEKIDWCSAFLIGPGLGRNENTFYIIKAAIEYALSKDKPMLIDADALFFLAQHPEIMPLLKENVILTPHHGEFIRLSGNSKQDMQEQPWAALEAYLVSSNCIVNLKGAPSMVGSKTKGIFINPTGNEGLAKGGSGDILAGLIAGFLSRGISAVHAAIFGNYFHGKAADDAIKDIRIPALQPTDLLDYLKKIIR